MEQKIQLSMAQGDFDNLKGKGKPLEKIDEGRSTAAHRKSLGIWWGEG